MEVAVGAEERWCRLVTATNHLQSEKWVTWPDAHPPAKGLGVAVTFSLQFAPSTAVKKKHDSNTCKRQSAEDSVPKTGEDTRLRKEKWKNFDTEQSVRFRCEKEAECMV